MNVLLNPGLLSLMAKTGFDQANDNVAPSFAPIFLAASDVFQQLHGQTDRDLCCSSHPLPSKRGTLVIRKCATRKARNAEDGLTWTCTFV